VRLVILRAQRAVGQLPNRVFTGGYLFFSAESLAAELLNPTKQCLIEGRFHIKEFDAHTDTRFENTNYRQGFDDLIFTRQSCANPASHFESLTCANKCAGDRKIGSYAADGRATFEI